MTNAIIQLPTNQDAAVPVQPAAAALPGGPMQPVRAPIITGATTAPLPAAPWQPPIFGSLAVVFGVASLFTSTLALAPLAIVLAVAAGLFRQTSWSIIGGASAIVALATSKYFWGLVAVVWLVDQLSWLWDWLS